MSQYAQAKTMETTPMESATATVCDDGGYFERRLGLSLARLLAPLDGPQPAGVPVRGSMAFRMIQQLRQSDDTTLPMGTWAIELRRANWPKVSQLAAGTLDTVGKDLQLGAWLLEAELQQCGYAALAPCFTLLRGLCDEWWEALHPRDDGEGFDARCNIVRWINEKLLNTIALLPLVEDDEHVASWSQWELAHYHERMRAVNGNLPDEAQEAATLHDLHELLARVDAAALRERHAVVGEGRAAIAAFEQALRERLGAETPSLGKLDELLARIEALLRGELTRRGPAALPPVASASGGDADEDTSESEGEPRSMANMLGEREHAYQMLTEIGEYLMQVEPHSPVPYLIRRAVAWGGLNAAELYREVFQKGGGRIDVFDLLGEQTDA
ncbi:type VI secretion system protein ImpA [Dyella sp. OK004]|uniref:type VI secretion system protein TssA n=1 Tax=Dyella sp. OK004 TaxID=1855292 RepID=UPI0008EDD7BB|nr:type VI secretion system protein TssA [Dyella sp. OK004]SFS13623.1 type VI secretion system protein ImpA [Dyella sp. OK004]